MAVLPVPNTSPERSGYKSLKKPKRTERPSQAETPAKEMTLVNSASLGLRGQGGTGAGVSGLGWELWFWLLNDLGASLDGDVVLPARQHLL